MQFRTITTITTTTIDTPDGGAVDLVEVYGPEGGLFATAAKRSYIQGHAEWWSDRTGLRSFPSLRALVESL